MRRPLGFTLIELLIVVVIVAIVAGLAMARYWESRRSVYVASIKWELRNALPRAEAHFEETGSYAGLALISQTSGVTVQVVEAGPTSYRLRGVHAQATGAACEVEGGALADGPASNGFAVSCDP